MKLLTLCYVIPTIPTESSPPRAEPGPEGIIYNEPSNPVDISDSSAALGASSSSSRQSAVETAFDYRSLFADEPTYADNYSSCENDKCGVDMSEIDFSSSSCLSLLSVRPVSVMVRRLPAKGETYRSVGEMQLKYRSCSILKVPRQSIMACSAAGVRSEGSGGGVSALMKKKRKKRRDHTELRTKQHTKHNKLWKSLMTPLATPPLTGSNKAAEDLIACQAALGSARMNTAEAILKREKRKMKNLGGFDTDVDEAVDIMHNDESDGREGQVKRVKTDTDIYPTASVGTKGSENRREMLAAAGRAAARAAIAAAAAASQNASCTAHNS